MPNERNKKKKKPIDEDEKKNVQDIFWAIFPVLDLYSVSIV